MRIEHDFEYPAHWTEIADEFCENDSEYQAEVFNNIGLQFKIWEQDKTRTSTHIQLLEIAEQLNDKGKWFINILHDYIEDRIGHWKHGVCDKCGYDWGNDAPIASVPKFCPNCGSPMEIER